MRIALHTRRGALRSTLARCLNTLGCEVVQLGDVRSLPRKVERHAAELAIVDLDDPEAGRCVEALRERFPSTAVLALSSDTRAEIVVEASHLGACEVLFKPFGRETLARAIGRSTAQSASGGEAPGTGFDEQCWIAEDARSLELLRRARQSARGSATVLISGDTGTGKTHLARCLQSRGPRASAPLVEISGAELQGQDGLARFVGRESSQTGERTAGAFERASGGTLLIEDVDELEIVAQDALLGFLSDGRIRSIGSSGFRHYDVRILATTRTNRIHGATAKLSSELRTRLGVISLPLLPLRERRDDILPLARHFYARASQERELVLDEHGIAALRGLTLPGNAAELQNLMRQAQLVLGNQPGERIDVERLQASVGPALRATGAASVDSSAGAAESIASAESASDRAEDLAALNLREMERSAVRRSLELAGGNRTLAARALGVSTRTLRNKIRAYDLR